MCYDRKSFKAVCFELFIIFSVLLFVCIFYTENVEADSIATPTVTSITSENNSVTIKWSQSGNPAGTKIEVTSFELNKIYREDEAKGAITISNLTKGDTFKFYIRACYQGSNAYLSSDYAGPYSIVVKSESASISSIPLNQWTGILNTEYDSNYNKTFSFTLTESGIVSLEMIAYIKPGVYSPLIWDAYIMNESGTNKYSDCESSIIVNDGNDYTRVPFRKMRLPRGKYIFKIDNKYAEGQFKFRIGFKSEENRSNVEKEFNNTRNTANSISLGKEYYGNNGTNDKDYYRFSLTRKSKVSFRVVMPDDNTSAIWDSVTVLNSDESKEFMTTNDQYDVVTDGDGTRHNQYSFDVTMNPGTYYLKIHKISNSKDYRFKVNSTPIITKPGKGYITSFKAGKKKATVKFSKISNATRYQIAFKKAGSDWTYYTTTSRSKAFKKLKSKKKYSVKVRGQRYEAGKWYSGAWSDTLTVKVK